jgi:hypothetical protein
MTARWQGAIPLPLGLVPAFLLAVAIGAGVGAAPRAVEAAEAVTFGSPAVTSTFLSGISISEAVTLPAGSRFVEAMVRTEGSVRTFVDPVPLPAAGATSLHYTFATPSGGLLPNTEVSLGFRVTLADGSTATGPLARVDYEDTRYAWQSLTGSLVRVHWVEGGAAFGQQVLAIAEKAVSDAATLLGVNESQPIDFYVYADRTAFYDVLGPAARENVGAAAFPDIRSVFANISSTDPNDPTVAIYIPHELTHVVFGDATSNPYHAPLHWLNEGLAVYLSQGYDAASRQNVEAAAGNGSLMPLSSIAGQFPTSADRFGLAYDEAVSAVDFMVRHYGRDDLVKLIQLYATGVSDDEAFRAGIGTDQAGFEAAWLAELHVPAPSPFGPQPAAAGPLPPGWAGTIAGAGSGGPGGGASGGQPAPSDRSPAEGSLLLVLAAIAVLLAGGLALLAIWTRRRA